MNKYFYNLFILLYTTAYRVAAIFNQKAKLGLQGRKNIFEKIKSVTPISNQPRIWMHCSSLGEFEQGRPVLESLKQEFPGAVIILTFFSASGYEVMKNYKGADHIFYLPMDSKSNAKKLVDALSPSLVLWVKYEFWFYYLHELKHRDIPVLLISGIFRPSQPFFRWYAGLWRKMLGCFTQFFVQNDSSKSLLGTVGIFDNIIVTGDTRFDRVIEIAGKNEEFPIIENFCGNSKILVAGSTWEDDEAELIHYARENPHIKFIIAPHEVNPENLKDVKSEFVNSIFYSELKAGHNPSIKDNPGNSSLPGGGDLPAPPNVLIIDNVGMLSRIYRYAHITYVGGGFGADGVHNVLEAAVYGKPVIFGPVFEKFYEAIGLVESGGGISFENAPELENILKDLWENESFRIEKGKAAMNYVYSNAGASNKIIRFIQEKRLLTN